jgi:hypothetical protein
MEMALQPKGSSAVFIFRGFAVAFDFVAAACFCFLGGRF